MTEREKYSLEFKSLLQKKPFLLENSHRFMPLPEYLNYFAKRIDRGFTYIIPPAYYRADIIDDFSEKIVYTSHLANSQGGTQLFTLVQVSPNTHIYFSFFYMEEQFYVGAEIYTTEASFIQEFLGRFADKEFFGKSNKSAGFGFGANSSN